LGWRWKKYVHPKCWYPPTSLQHGIVNQKIKIWIFSNVSKENTASFFEVKDGGSMCFQTLVPIYQSTRCYSKQKYRNMNLHRRELTLHKL
jgi:hypothetical protein